MLGIGLNHAPRVLRGMAQGSHFQAVAVISGPCWGGDSEVVGVGVGGLDVLPAGGTGRAPLASLLLITLD